MKEQGEILPVETQVEIPCEKDHNGEECKYRRRAIQDTMDVLSGKWKLPIIYTLSFRSMRFKEIEREVNITARMLSKELKELEQNKLVSRTVHNSMPVTVEYSITPYGRTLWKVLDELSEWGINHRKEIMK
jgi:DNA-binding HxlR family transcriptional regulator